MLPHSKSLAKKLRTIPEEIKERVVYSYVAMKYQENFLALHQKLVEKNPQTIVSSFTFREAILRDNTLNKSSLEFKPSGIGSLKLLTLQCKARNEVVTSINEVTDRPTLQ